MSQTCPQRNRTLKFSLVSWDLRDAVAFTLLAVSYYGVASCTCVSLSSFIRVVVFCLFSTGHIKFSILRYCGWHNAPCKTFMGISWIQNGF